jgi:hypothetical protein
MFYLVHSTPLSLQLFGLPLRYNQILNMRLSPEAIVGIITLLVTCPPAAFAIFALYKKRRRRQQGGM